MRILGVLCLVFGGLLALVGFGNLVLGVAGPSPGGAVLASLILMIAPGLVMAALGALVIRG